MKKISTGLYNLPTPNPLARVPLRDKRWIGPHIWRGSRILPTLNESAVRFYEIMTIKEAYRNAVEKQVKANSASGWGERDSVAVIEAIVDAAYLDDEAGGFDGVREYVRNLVNPSAFAQKLEKLDEKHPCRIVRQKKAGGSKLDL